MKINYTPKVTASSVKYATEEVDGLKIAYREAGTARKPEAGSSSRISILLTPVPKSHRRPCRSLSCDFA